MKIKTPRGAYDILPPLTSVWQEVEENARRACSLYNYRELRTPLFEDTSLFVRSIGEDTDIVEKEMYTFRDRKGRSLTLRPEGTAPAVRAYLEHNLALRGGVVKLFYVGPFFRYERMQAGRQRQFHQFGAEAIGSDSPALDAELIMLASDFIELSGVRETRALLNNTGCSGCREEYMIKLRRYLQTRTDRMCPDCMRRTKKNPLRVFDCKKPSCAGLKEGAPPVMDSVCGECSGHFESVRFFLDEAGFEYGIDRFLVRGLDYYTKTTFEISHPGLGAQNALAGGGRYDLLVEELGGSPAPAAGFACGLERIILALGEKTPPGNGRDELKVFVACPGSGYFGKAFRAVLKLRREGISCDLDYQGRSLKSQMKLADRLGAGFTVIAGDDFELRNMSEGAQESMPLEKIIGVLKQRKNSES